MKLTLLGSIRARRERRCGRFSAPRTALVTTIAAVQHHAPLAPLSPSFNPANATPILRGHHHKTTLTLLLLQLFLLLLLISYQAAVSLSTHGARAHRFLHADARQRAVRCENASGGLAPCVRIWLRVCRPSLAQASQIHGRDGPSVSPRLPRFSLRFRSGEDGAAAAASFPHLLRRTNQ